MRTDVAQPIRLADYRPPDYLIDTVDLDVSLDPHATRVVARLAVRPNPKGRSGADLVLDGDGLVARRIVLDGQELDSKANFVTPDQLTIAGAAAAALHARNRDRDRPFREYIPDGPLSLWVGLLHPMRS